jgi:predicted alpha/beta superfamily hydrolase
VVSSAFLVVSLIAAISLAGEGAQRFELESKAVGATYEIEVVFPLGSPAAGQRLPTVYCTDWFVLSDYLKSLPKLMTMGRLTQPHILVGISAGTTMDEWAKSRTRDFTPARPSDDYSKAQTYPPAFEVAGGASRFASFLKDELVPLIESKQPSDPSRRVFVGYSLGSLFGTYLLAKEPQLFQSYLLGSPSCWFNDYRLASEVRDAPKERLRSVTKIYLSVGEEESWEMLKGYGLLRDAFREKGLSGSRIKAEIIPDAGHVGAMPISLYNGLRFLLHDD